MTQNQAPLYDPSFEHDNCGIGAVVNIKGKKSHRYVDQALQIVEKLEHRAGKDATGETGDGVGIMTQIPHTFFPKSNRRIRYRARQRARLWRWHVLFSTKHPAALASH